MQFITSTVKTKAVVDGADVVSRVITKQIVLPQVPAIVKNHPIIASYVAYRAGKSLGQTVRSLRRPIINEYTTYASSDGGVALRKAQADDHLVGEVSHAHLEDD